MCWSPFQESQSFVGTHGTLLGTPVSGFLVSQQGNLFASLLTFTTTTASTATVTTQETTDAGASLIFTLKGDAITNISYANVYNGTHSSIPLTATTAAIVTVDGDTGLIDLVIPAIAGKARPSVTKSSGSTLTYNGQFSGIYDSTGKNIASGGITTLSFDKATGKLLSYR